VEDFDLYCSTIIYWRDQGIYYFTVTLGARQFLKGLISYYFMKKFILMLGLILSLGIVMAHDFDYKEKFVEERYFPKDLFVISKTTWTDYNNDNRFSTGDYRHGYSYRATQDYFDRKVKSKLRDHNKVDIKKSNRKVLSSKKNYNEKSYRKVLNHERKRISYDYVPHLRKYEGRECYVNPPADRLFYIKC